MYLGRRFSLSEKRVKKVVLAIMAIYVLIIQLPLLSLYRSVPLDEMQLVDAAYGVSSGESTVPAGFLWSHIIPETGTFFAAYPPLYLYLQAVVLKLVGLTPLTIGSLHLLLRLMAAAVFFLVCRKMTGVVISALFVALWATMAIGPVGRYEDLAVLFLLISVYFLLEQKNRLYQRYLLVGLFAGLTFLTYPLPLGLLLPLCLVTFLHYPNDQWSRENLRALAGKYLSIVLVAATISATWLFWIVPYWHEFKVHFLEFAVPDAFAPSYTKSLADLVRYVTGGFLTSPFPFHYSLLPVLGLLGVLIFLDFKRNGFSLKTFLAIALPLIVAALTARVRIHKTYNLIWFIVTLLTLLPILWSQAFTERYRFNRASFAVQSIIVLLAGVIGFQLVAHLMLVGLGRIGDIAAVEACGPDPHAHIINGIPSGDKVLTNSPYIFYGIRHRNPLYWPGGLQGDTPGRVPFSTTYDDTFRWLVLTKPLAEVNLNDEDSPGAKFSWDSDTLTYFRAHYALVETSDLTKECSLNRGLSRFSSMTRALYIYQRQ